MVRKIDGHNQLKLTYLFLLHNRFIAQMYSNRMRNVDKHLNEMSYIHIQHSFIKFGYHFKIKCSRCNCGFCHGNVDKMHAYIIILHRPTICKTEWIIAYIYYTLCSKHIFSHLDSPFHESFIGLKRCVTFPLLFHNIVAYTYLQWIVWVLKYDQQLFTQSIHNTLIIAWFYFSSKLWVYYVESRWRQFKIHKNLQFR